MKDRDHIDFWGANIRLQPLQAVVALEGLRKIDNVIKKRNKLDFIVSIYDSSY